MLATRPFGIDQATGQIMTKAALNKEGLSRVGDE